MNTHFIKVSPGFRKMAKKSILAIILFITIYFVLFTTAVALTALCTYLGIALITAHPAIYTIIAGFGLICIGFLILIFLVKFMFTSHKVDRSHLVEIYRNDQPQLFSLIDEIVKEIQTDFPKKIYLSSEVNAAVFYDSNFWSMFFPVRKNLQIGIGLVNSVTVTEFKAILAHEFGHFSQRTMKVGSYVFHVNQIIYNLLYDNSKFENLAGKLAGIHGIITFFVRLALAIISGIQWILRKIYAVLNLNYLALSREMEYHADEVAATVAGSAPLSNALLRLDLANYSLDKVLTFYNSKIDSAVKTSDLYPQQYLVMNFLAKEVELNIENQLPHVPLTHLSKYNKSKLVIKDQWSSHPSTEDRVEALNKLNISSHLPDNRIAIALFHDSDTIKTILTGKIFSTVGYEGKETLITTEQFMEEFQVQNSENSFPKIYRGYYDDKNPKYNLDSDIDNSATFEINDEISLFDDNAINLVYTSNGLTNDIGTLKQLNETKHQIQSFDYDGQKYNVTDCNHLIEQLEKELTNTKDKIYKNDLRILNYFNFRAKEKNEQAILLEKYNQMTLIDSMYETDIKLHNDVIEGLGFIHEVTPFATITNRFFNLKPKEARLKEKIKAMLIDPIYQKSISKEARTSLEKYVERTHEYFWEFNNEYNNASLEVLFDSLGYFQQILLSTYFEVKRELLVYQANLSARA